MSFNDWLDHVLESAVDSCTFSDPTRDPVDIVIEVEHEVITAFGFNLNYIYVKEK